MSDKERGLYGKFNVTRTDGRSAPGEKHENCSYFCLDLTHDVYAVSALKAYADACVDEYPKLSADLRIIAAQLEHDLKTGCHPGL